MRYPSFSAVVLLCLVVGVPAAGAQSADTGILGTVADVSGAVIPGSEVTVTPATAVANTVVSGSNGEFEIRYLAPGGYTVEVTLQGFRAQRTTVMLRVSQMLRLDFTLEIGKLGEVVDVEAQGQLLETQSGVTGDVVTAEALENLPLAGRNS